MAEDAPQRRPWTVMVYMAGDNGQVFDTQYGKMRLMASMAQAGYQDLIEMGTVGTTDRVAAVCLFDTQEATYRVEVRKGRGWADSRVQPMPGVNTGDPATLRQFIVESVRAYPADHYALIIWNHGTGWLDVNVYAGVRALGGAAPLFKRETVTLPDGATRPIAFDDSSKDFLDTADLRQALADAAAETGARLDLIGMDACLMAMVEGAHELAAFADYFVASQEVEPMDGWPYAPILAALDKEPDLLPAALADRIVREFARSYRAATRAEENVTQSAIALGRVARTLELCQHLVAAIAAGADPALKGLVKGVLVAFPAGALTFQDRNYRDLGDFVLKLMRKTEYSNYQTVYAAARALYNHLEVRGPSATVLQVAYRPRYKGATGLSVFLPPKLGDLLDIYRNLAFPALTGWDNLLTWLFDDFGAQWPA